MLKRPEPMNAAAANRPALGALSLICTVRSSSAVIDVTPTASTISDACVARVLYCFQLYSTSFASMARALVGGRGSVLALLRIFAMTVSLSGDTSCDSTRSPTVS